MPTNITVKPDTIFPEEREVRVNGRFVAHTARIRSIKKVRPGEWEGIARTGVGDDLKFVIWGGWHAGGGSREWGVAWEGIFGDIRAKSAVECIRILLEV